MKSVLKVKSNHNCLRKFYSTFRNPHLSFEAGLFKITIPNLSIYGFVSKELPFPSHVCRSRQSNEAINVKVDVCISLSAAEEPGRKAPVSQDWFCLIIWSTAGHTNTCIQKRRAGTQSTNVQIKTQAKSHLNDLKPSLFIISFHMCFAVCDACLCLC